jgi:NADP-dependent 3-hydroxy acid dehydrogenase YdfG
VLPSRVKDRVLPTIGAVGGIANHVATHYADAGIEALMIDRDANRAMSRPHLLQA